MIESWRQIIAFSVSCTIVFLEGCFCIFLYYTRIWSVCDLIIIELALVFKICVMLYLTSPSGNRMEHHRIIRWCWKARAGGSIRWGRNPLLWHKRVFSWICFWFWANWCRSHGELWETGQPSNWWCGEGRCKEKIN